MKKILIIGGCGYIGSSLYNFFSKKYKTDSVDLEWFGNFNIPNNKKLDFVNLTEADLNEYTHIILVAANSSVPLCKNIKDTFDNNVIKFISLVNKIKKQKFIYASSSCVYVTSDGRPKVETDTLYPSDGLTLSKTTIDNYMSLTDVEYYGLRFGSVNGWSPNMRLDLMINSMTMSAINDNVVNVFNGYAYRPIISINDLCRSVDSIIETSEDNRGVYNLASFNSNIFEIAKSVSDYMNVPLKDNGKNYTYDFTISSEKFIKTFNFKFEDKIENIIDTIVNNPKNINWSKRDYIKYEL